MTYMAAEEVEMEVGDAVGRWGRLSEFQPDPDNPNEHTERGLDLQDKSVGECGPGRAPVFDDAKKAIAGNAIIETYASHGYDKVYVVDVYGPNPPPVCVVRHDLSLDDPKTPARKLSYYDNESGRVGVKYKSERLHVDFQNKDTGVKDVFTPIQLRTAFEEIERFSPTEERVEKAEKPVEDGEGEAKILARVEPGDEWVVGPHHILCGDCTDGERIPRYLGNRRFRLMTADPPYGIKTHSEMRDGLSGRGDNPGTSLGEIANEERESWLEAYKIPDVDVSYIWHGSTPKLVRSVLDDIEGAKFVPVQEIIWAKYHWSITMDDYQHQHECCWYSVRKGRTRLWTGGRDQSTLWRVSSLQSYTNHEEHWDHRAQKPIELYLRPIRWHTMPGDLIYDPCAGSGTAAAAAWTLGRVSYSVEIMPEHCDKILTRLERLSGEVARKVKGG